MKSKTTSHLTGDQGSCKSILNFFFLLTSFLLLSFIIPKHSISDNIDSLKSVVQEKTGPERAAKLDALGMAYLAKGMRHEALASFSEALRIYEAYDSVRGQAVILSMMGKIKTDLSEYDQAMDLLFASQRLFQQVDDPEYHMFLLNRIGVVYIEISEEEKALGYFKQVLEIAQKMADSNRIASILSNIGIIYARIGQHDKAIQYYKRSLSIIENRPDKFGVAIFHNNIGVQYFRQKKYQKALDHYLQSLNILKDLPDKNLLAEAHGNAGEALSLLGRYEQAESHLFKALEISREIGEKITEQNAYAYLAQLYELKNNFRKALKYHKLSAQLKDSIFSERKTRQIAELQTQYETEKKESEITRLEYAAELQQMKMDQHRKTRILLFLLAGLSIITLVILIFSFRRKVKTSRILTEKNKELDHYAQHIKKVDKLRRELISNVSHDLRSPLSIIHGYIETLLIKDRVLTPVQRRKYLEIILNGSDRLKRLVTDLFDLSKLEARQVNVNEEPFFINELLNDTVQQYLLMAKKKNIHVKTNIHKSLPMVKADISLMERVIQNLVSNAIQYTPENGEIALNVTSRDEEIEINIRNTGAGIPKEMLPHIFNRYYKIDREKGGIKGSGLGLAIVKKILDLHNMPVSVDSESGKYASFSFRMPVYRK